MNIVAEHPDLDGYLVAPKASALAGLIRDTSPAAATEKIRRSSTAVEGMPIQHYDISIRYYNRVLPVGG